MERKKPRVCDLTKEELEKELLHPEFAEADAAQAAFLLQVAIEEGDEAGWPLEELSANVIPLFPRPMDPPPDPAA